MPIRRELLRVDRNVFFRLNRIISPSIFPQFGKVVQLVSYEGKFTAGNGPAKGLASDPIRPLHGSTNGRQSLQLKGKGRVYNDFTWSALFDFTPGEVNNAFINDK